MDELINKKTYNFDDLLLIMNILRRECPWDREQTHQSLIEPLIEEAYELKSALLKEDVSNMCEELGDVLLQVIFHSLIAKENNNFNIDDVITTLVKKLIYRHPHVFSTKSNITPEKVSKNWEELKKIEKGQTSYTQSLEDIAEALPALLRAKKVQEKASKVGFDWNEAKGVFDKLQEEMNELVMAYNEGEKGNIEEEFGDLLFTMVNLSRFFKINPEFALTNGIEKFINRFRYIEIFANETGRRLDEMTLEEMDALWQQAKSCT